MEKVKNETNAMIDFIYIMKEEKMKKEVDVVLIDCAFIGQKKIAEPLGICYLASALREKEISVKILEPAIEGWGIDEIITEISNFKCKVIGLSAIRDENIKGIFKLVNELKKVAKVFVGGHGPSIGVLAQKDLYIRLGENIDGFIVGEGEKSFTELVQSILQGKNWRDCKGLAYINDNGKLFINSLPDKISNINTLPFMARDILEEYIKKYGQGIEASLLSSRGCCFGHCTYCSVGIYERIQKGDHSRYRTISNIVDEIIYLYEMYGINKFNFEDDNFFMYGSEGRTRIYEFIEKIKDLYFKIEFTLYCRADLIQKDIFLQLKSVGLKGIFLGIESFYDETLKFFNKGLRAEHMFRALDTLYNIGFSAKPGSEYRIHVGFIFWHPKITVEEMEITLTSIKKYGMSTKLFTRKLFVYSGCPIEKLLYNEGLLDKGSNVWRYKKSYMEIVEKEVCSFINEVNVYRDSIRTLEKASLQFGIDILQNESVYSKLYKTRLFLDDSCLEYMEKIIYIIKQKPTELKKTIKSLDLHFRKKITRYMEDNKIEKRIAEMQKKLYLESNDIDLFRK